MNESSAKHPSLPRVEHYSVSCDEAEMQVKRLFANHHF